MTQTSNDGVPAVILAGGRADDEIALAGAKAVKALVELGGRPMVSYVIDALKAAGVGPIWVVTSVEAAREMFEAVADGAQVLATAEPYFTDTLEVGLTAAGKAPSVLICTGDLPLLTAEAVRDFLDRARATGAEVIYSAVAIDDLKPPYEGEVRTKVKLREGRVSGGNVVLANPQALRRAVAMVQRAFAGRKNPFALARLFGVSFIARYLLGTLDVPTLRVRGSRMLGCKVDVVISKYPEICFDIDHPEHLHVARRVLEERQGRSEA
jgi:GTP:adenosylcobinamide-phosphate guanylyltransferase